MLTAGSNRNKEFNLRLWRRPDKIGGVNIDVGISVGINYRRVTDVLQCQEKGRRISRRIYIAEPVRPLAIGAGQIPIRQPVGNAWITFNHRMLLWISIGKIIERHIT